MINRTQNWWGDYRVPHDQFGLWKIGPLSLCIQRLAGEWRVSYDVGPDAFEDDQRIAVPCDGTDPPPPAEQTTRYAVSDGSETVRLSPRLPDRPLVTRSENTLHVLPFEQTTIFASVPVWVIIEVGEEHKTLCEIPIFRPTDTWFGADTQSGRLCYASRSFHRVRLSQVPVLPHRATTEVVVHNQADTMLSLERMLIPVTHLSIYRSEEGALWTDDLFLERNKSDDFAMLRTRARGIKNREANRANDAAIVSHPRETSRDNLMLRAFGTLFNHQSESL